MLYAGINRKEDNCLHGSEPGHVPAADGTMVNRETHSFSSPLKKPLQKSHLENKPVEPVNCAANLKVSMGFEKTI